MIKTVSLETAKALKDAGFPQTTNFHHNDQGMGHYHIGAYRPDMSICAAPTTDELLEELPKDINGYPLHIEFYKIWLVYYNDRNILNRIESWKINDSLSESLAAMYLWLSREGMIKKGNV